MKSVFALLTVAAASLSAYAAPAPSQSKSFLKQNGLDAINQKYVFSSNPLIFIPQLNLASQRTAVLRLGVGTDRGSAVNIHLLVSPDDQDHLARLHAFLSDLRFEAMGERYRCTPADIMRLGRAHDANAMSDEHARSKSAPIGSRSISPTCARR